jgi:glycosyltransferase involved in cell wall biosynthesis
VLYAPEKDRAPPQPFASALIDFGPEPFALVMNAAREEKNAASVVAAFDALFSQPAFAAAHPRLKVALTGIDSIDDLGLQPVAHGERFVAFPHLPAGHLEFLLREAAFLVYASFNEGFGYPPLEAMTHGTPSIIAGNTAVPEICGEAAVRCDPFDIESIIGAITTILSGPPDPALLRFQLAAVGARQAADLQRIVRQICCRDEAAASRPLAVEEANQ